MLPLRNPVTNLQSGDTALSVSTPVRVCACLSSHPSSSLGMRYPLNPTWASWGFALIEAEEEMTLRCLPEQLYSSTWGSGLSGVQG